MTPQPVAATFLSSATDAWGAEESLLALAPKLVDHGVSPTLKTANVELAERWSQVVGAPTEVVAQTHMSVLQSTQYWARQIPSSSREACVLFNIDLIPAAVVTRLQRRRRAALILDLHDYLPSRSGRAKVRLGAWAFDSVISVSRFSASQVAHRSGTVLTRPVSGVPESRKRDRSGAPVVGVIGRIDPDKNLEMIVDAASMLPADTILVLRGDSMSQHVAYRNDLIGRARLIWGDRLEFEGRVPRTEALDGIDVLVVGNAHEALGRTVLEAQLAGVPVVVPDRGGAAELVKPGVTGFTFRADDIRDLAAAIASAFQAPTDLIESARHFAMTSSDPEKYAQAYARVIRSTMR